ncbi:cation diffusion facilitator family transporter [Leptolyngbya sp. O-77]|uniref:cation diffusion facilitator family transporter n=1 Tax=Leptolyngbya sp. O-77 TaxID=1080068 RepID=UPI00074D3909|nr:cation diffusion facilitator family transporter [Leptolyngbya sp. O-77]BAU42438.1 Cadmium, cobalt and zinc/H(+)-K(+) antiporter [Leptolyngbya sp. O-77]
MHTAACPEGCQAPHPHTVDVQKKAKLLWMALGLIGGFSLVELAVSLSSHSLALLAEAGHMLSDVAALALALLATWIAGWPPSAQAPFGYRRVEILAALANGLGLVAIALWIGWEAVERLQHPDAEILGLPMLITAAVGLGINLVNASLLHDHSHHDLNLKGAFLHMVSDAIGSVGVILAAIAVWLFGWAWADGAISLLVAALILVGAIPLIRQSLNILLEKAPAHLDPDTVQAHLLQTEGVQAVENLRLWAIAPGQMALTAHLTVNPQDGPERDRLLQTLQASLQTTFGLTDTTLQLAAPPATPRVNLSMPPSLELVVKE